MGYKLLLHPIIEKQLAKIPAPFNQRLVNAMRALCTEPRPAQAKHLTQGLYRIRVGEYRVVYAVFDQEGVVFVGKVARRSEKIYRDLNVLLASARKSADID
jgi:mRNA interferase RelE/StbE